jgi:hypothetical protein
VSQPVFMRRTVDGLMPRGSIFHSAPGGDLDHLLDGIADNAQTSLDDLEFVAHLRDPSSVPLALLPDLEREFGITPDSALSEPDRRKNLAVLRYKRRKLTSVARLQDALDRAGFGTGGFGLIVTPNASPATDPASIVDNAYQLTAHEIGEGMSAGNSSAYAAKRGGYYLVNGDKYILEPVYPQAGQICARAFDGSDSLSGEGCAGHYNSYTQYTNEHTTPPEGYWPLIFFVGGVVARNENGSIAAVSTVWIPSHRRQELHRLALRYKPLGTWAAMIVQYN